MEKYGLIEEKNPPPSEKKRKASTAADAVIAAAVEEDVEDRPKKANKIDSVAVEENRAIAEAIREMATIYFKNKDARKGGQLSSECINNLNYMERLKMLHAEMQLLVRNLPLS